MATIPPVTRHISESERASERASERVRVCLCESAKKKKNPASEQKGANGSCERFEKKERKKRSSESAPYLHHLGRDLQLAESVDEDVGRHPRHAQHPALGAPGHDLNGEGVLVRHLHAALVLLGSASVKHLGCFEFVEHLEHYWVWRHRGRVGVVTMW